MSKNYIELKIDTTGLNRIQAAILISEIETYAEYLKYKLLGDILLGDINE